MKTQRLAALALLSLPVLSAQAEGGDYASFGAAALVWDQPYVGGDTEVSALPFVQGQWRDFFLQGTTLGYGFLKEDAFKLSALLNLRLNHLESEDLDPALPIEERKRTVEAGVGLSMPLVERITLDAHALIDVLDRHGGYEVGLRLSRASIMGNLILAPSVGVSLLSKDFTAYYYGLQPGEAGVAAGYEPGDVIVPQLGLSAFYPLNPQWTLTGLLGARYLGSDIGDSPLMDAEWENTLLIGASYRLPLN